MMIFSDESLRVYEKNRTVYAKNTRNIKVKSVLTKEQKENFRHKEKIESLLRNGFIIMNLPIHTVEKKIQKNREVWNFPPLPIFKGNIKETGSTVWKNHKKKIISRYGIIKKKWKLQDGFCYYYVSRFSPNKCDYLKVFVFTDEKRNVQNEIWVF